MSLFYVLIIDEITEKMTSTKSNAQTTTSYGERRIIGCRGLSFPNDLLNGISIAMKLLSLGTHFSMSCCLDSLIIVRTIADIYNKTQICYKWNYMINQFHNDGSLSIF